MAPEFLHNKGNYVRFYKTVVLMNVYPLYHGVSFYPLLFSFCLQIRKVRNLQIGIDKLARKISLNLLGYTVSKLSKLYTYKQNRFNKHL